MDDEIKRKAVAAGKMTFGVARMVGAVVTATGHGLIGAYCRKHHMMAQATRLAKASIEAGQKSVKEGWEEWNRK